MMALSAASQLAFWEGKLRQAQEYLTDGVPVNSHSLDGQTVAKESTPEWLAFCEQQIAKYQRIVSGGLPASRNRILFKRNG